MNQTKPLCETPAAFARRLGVHKSTISRAIAAGRLQIVGGLLDVAVNLRLWAETKPGTRPDVQARHAAHRAAVEPSIAAAGEIATATQGASYSAPTAPAETDGEPPDEDNTLQTYRKQTMQAENNLMRLAMRLRNGSMVQLDRVVDEAHHLGGSLRQSLERLIDQTAPQLAAVPDVESRRRLLAGRTRDLQRTIRREFIRALRRVRKEAT